ncbi:hypothetical protein VPNG_03864 [Cytospora leucostoma]|uniref:Uncharacterized protein n=1 Tax=Cytospora leucostoma TaxID=1230097 RepID=A0A423XEB2_9PEZI|nr:hypothetical protein VPNG_03864 [Cytospora leucostoma]
MPAESMEMPQMNMVAQPQTTEQPKAQEPMSMSLRGGGLCEDVSVPRATIRLAMN